MRKARAAAVRAPIPFLVSHPRRPLHSIPPDLLRAKAVDRSLQQSSTDRTKTTATVLCRLAMRETYEHPTILWRRVGHQLLHETGPFLPSRMPPKVRVLFYSSTLSPSVGSPQTSGLFLSYFVQTMPFPTFYRYSSASRFASTSFIGTQFLQSGGNDGPGFYHLSSRPSISFFYTLIARLIQAEQCAFFIFPISDRFSAPSHLAYPFICALSALFANASSQQNKPTRYSRPYFIQRSHPPLHAALSHLFAQVPLRPMQPPPLPRRAVGDYFPTTHLRAPTLPRRRDVWICRPTKLIL
jgi:hypothetical protein